MTLLLIVLVVVGSAANQVDGASLVNPLQNATVDLFDLFFNQNVSHTVEETGTHIRKHLLYNLCSEKIVKIIRNGRKGINARGKIKGKNMNLSKLIFESTPSGTIKIYGEHTGLHMCFNKRGRLRAKVNGKSKLCQFKEEYSDNNKYTHYRTADTTERFYLGFKKNGKPLKGTRKETNRKNEDCYKFQKVYPNRTSVKPVCPPGTGNGPEGVNFCDNNLLNIVKQDRNKIRHDSKHHKRRGKG